MRWVCFNMKKSKLVIFGNTNQAEMANYYFKNDTDYTVDGFVVDDDYYEDDIFCGKPVIPYSQMHMKYPKEEWSCFVAIGYAEQNRVRERVYQKIKNAGYCLPSYVSTKATVFNTLKVGDNCFILEDNTIQPFAQIGNNVCLWSGNHIGHHVIIEDNCFITSHVVVSGGVVVGKNSFIGVNSSIRDHITIAEYSLIGAHSWINKSTVPYGVYSNKGTEMVREEI